MNILQVQVKHAFREANQLADKLANLALENQAIIQAHHFRELPVACRGILNMDKA